MQTIIQKAAFAAAILLPAFASAHAASDAALPQREVRFGELNLRTDAGVAALNRRVRVAVRSVCGSRNATMLEDRMRAMTCERNATRAARPQVDLAVAHARDERYAAASTQVAVAAIDVK